MPAAIRPLTCSSPSDPGRLGSCSPRAPRRRVSAWSGMNGVRSGCPGARRSCAQASPMRGSALDHRPVRAEREDRAAAADVGPAEAGRDLLGLQVVAPVERPGLVEVGGVQRLHRGGDALGGEARELGVAQRLDVLDPVRRAAARAGVAVGVERGRDRAVADRVRRALEAGAREARDDLGVALRDRARTARSPRRAGRARTARRCPCRSRRR